MPEKIAICINSGLLSGKSGLMSLPDWARRKQAHRKTNILLFEFRNLLTSFVGGLRKSNIKEKKMKYYEKWVKRNTPRPMKIEDEDYISLIKGRGIFLTDYEVRWEFRPCDNNGGYKVQAY